MNKRTLLAPLAALSLSAALLAGCVAASVNGGFTLAEGTIVDSDGSTVTVKMSSATDGNVTITVEVTIKDGKVTALKGSDTEGNVGEVK